uniref:B30.2/SPRY domain-containing protein n=1 Tax=Ditylum brightwellii TaxID=49249 RepID=A0A7S4VV69_9STRA
MLRVTSRQRLVSWDEFDAADHASQDSSSSSSLTEDIPAPAIMSRAATDDAYMGNNTTNEAPNNTGLVGKKRDRRSSHNCNSPFLPKEQQMKENNDTNNKRTVRKSVSFTDLVKLSSSSRIAPQPLSEAAQITMPPHSPVVSMPVIIPPHPSTSFYSSAHDINNTDDDDDDDEYGFTFPLDEEESVNGTNQSYETLVAGVVESHRSHYERVISCSTSPEEGFAPAPTSFKTTENPCCDGKPHFEKSLLTWENSTVNILTLLESTSDNGIGSGACGIKSLPPPLPSTPDIGLVDLMDDAILHALSYLTSADIRNVSATCRETRSLINAPETHHFWLDICQRESWGSSLSVLSKCSSGEEHRHIKFRDDSSIPVAGIAQSIDEDQNINLSVLLGLTANSYPAAIDPAFFRNNIGRRTRYSVHRRHPEFRTYHLTCDPARLKTSRPDFDGEDVGEFGTDTLTVVQFSSRVGVGDRCIKSDQPFPRLENKFSNENNSKQGWYMRKRHDHSSSYSPSTLRDQNISHRRRFPTLRLSSSPTSFVMDFLCRGSSVLTPPTNQSLSSRPLSSHSHENISSGMQTPARDSSTTSMRPFVLPRVISEGADIIEVDVTPCLVAYFEVTILPRHRSKEPPLPIAPSSSSNFSHRAAAADAAFAASHEIHQRLADSENLFNEIDALRARLNRNEPLNVANDIPLAPPTHKDCVAVGLSTASFTTQHKMPGWDEHSYGYHGDDGGIFHAGGDMIRKFGPTFGMYDTVGCGIDYKTKSIFFTRNGEFLGFAFAELDDSILQNGLYPTVGVDTNCPLFINFGEKPFEFSLEPFRKWSAVELENGLSGLLRPCGLSGDDCGKKMSASY